jgi:hypothetical protein
MPNDAHSFRRFLPSFVISAGTQQAPADLDWEIHAARLAELEVRLDQVFEESSLPEDRDRKAINEFLVRLRLG